MQCNMPNCKNLSAKKLCSTEIVNGVHTGLLTFYACPNHPPLEVYQQVKKTFEAKAASLQISNPLKEVKMHKNTASPAK